MTHWDKPLQFALQEAGQPLWDKAEGGGDLERSGR